MNRFLLVTIILWMAGPLYSCESTVKLKLINNRGGVYIGKIVILTSVKDARVYKTKSNGDGMAELLLPCNERFRVSIDNYTKNYELKSPDDGGTSVQTLSYSPDMAQKAKAFAMTDIEKGELDKVAISLPDTSYLKDVLPLVRSRQEYFQKFTLEIRDLSDGPLANETVILTGVRRGKSFKGVTNAAGKLVLQIIKGDEYKLHFSLDKDYATEVCEYSKGISETDISISYIGTKEKLRRIAEEKKRIAEEEKRLKEEKRLFAEWCKKLKISESKGRERELYDKVEKEDTVITSVLNRNKWSNMLIVCDVTGSMSPYAAQLALWFRLNCVKHKNLQFVLFNDGDNKSEAEKKIGSTGGIYYKKTSNPDSLIKFVAMVEMRGGGGDCPENNMEALIKGTAMASAYTELVMVADNHAPVKDIELLKSFSKPVHIILCGVDTKNVQINLNYLEIARKTGGSIHTMEQDILNLAQLTEGEEITINGFRYRIMGGKFVSIYKT